MGGNVYCWGEASDGAVGMTGSDLTQARVVAGVSGATDLGVGVTHSCVVSGGAVWCWGANNQGQLGNGTSGATPVTTPQQFLVDDDGPGPGLPTAVTDAVDVEAGEQFTCVRRSGSISVSCAGWGSTYRLGNGALSRQTAGVPVNLPMGVSATTLALGLGHACVLGSDNLPYCWGQNYGGQAGQTPSSSGLATPSVVTSAPPSVTAIWAGMESSCLLFTHPVDGPTLQCFGRNAVSNLQLGRNAPQGDYHIPANVVTDTGGPLLGVSDLIGYQRGWCARIGVGAYTCWGNNHNDIYGVTTPTHRGFAVPSQTIPGLFP